MSVAGILPPTQQRSYYEIVSKISRGGMGEVYLARNVGARDVVRDVVLKRVISSMDVDEEVVAAFLSEARLSFGLCHPNIAHVYDFAELGGAYYLALEYVHGKSLLELLQRSYELQHPVPLGHILTIAVGICAGLDHAHNQVGENGGKVEIVHRDITPSNVMVSYGGAVKIVDFGIAKQLAEQSFGGDTQVGVLKGKAGYTAPERIVGRGSLDRRCDLYSLGVVMWELCTGRELFRRPTDLESLDAAIREVPPLPSRFRSEIPPALDAIIACALQKEPNQRFSTASEMLTAIENAAFDAKIMLSNHKLGLFISTLFEQEQLVDGQRRRLARGSVQSLASSNSSRSANGGRNHSRSASPESSEFAETVELSNVLDGEDVEQERLQSRERPTASLRAVDARTVSREPAGTATASSEQSEKTSHPQPGATLIGYGRPALPPKDHKTTPFFGIPIHGTSGLVSPAPENQFSVAYHEALHLPLANHDPVQASLKPSLRFDNTISDVNSIDSAASNAIYEETTTLSAPRRQWWLLVGIIAAAAAGGIAAILLS